MQGEPPGQVPPGFASPEELARRRKLHPFFVEPATPEAERQLEIAALRAELAWILSTECPAVFTRIAALLEGCLAQLQDASATSNRNEPLRGESQDDGALRFALTLGPRDLQALQVQLCLPTGPPLAWRTLTLTLALALALTLTLTLTRCS
tara:strand:- start:197 stop:649 length:453 start_codon:yes stop_codon:yes gene_type:complete